MKGVNYEEIECDDGNVGYGYYVFYSSGAG
jgi:hypothetical protein